MKKLFLKTISLFGNLYLRILKKPEKRIDKKSIKKILIIKPCCVGDILFTTPSLRAIRKKFPNARISYLIGNWSKIVIELNPNVDEVIVFDDDIIFKKRIIQFFRLIREIKEKKFDVAIVFHPLFVYSLLTFMAKIPVRIGFDRGGEGFLLTHRIPYLEKHEVDRCLEVVGLMGAKTDNKELDFYISKSDRKFADDFFKDTGIAKKDFVVAIAPGGCKNPGGEMPSRRWSYEKYAQLSDILCEKYNARVIIIGGKGDGEIIEKTMARMKKKTINSFIKTKSLRQIAALIEKCDLFISHDSGLTHVANAMKTPIIVMFGPTNMVEVGPMDKKHTVVTKNLHCSPCYRHGIIPRCKTVECMRSITVEDVLNFVEKYYQTNQRKGKGREITK